MMNYPRPDSTPRSEHPLQARALQPLEPPPHTVKPTLPSPPRRSLLDASFALTTHLIPAAYPRTTPIVPAPELPTWSPDKAQFQEAVARTADKVMLMKHKQRYGGLHEPLNRNPLWACVNRYVRREIPQSSLKSVTLFFSHANGFTKELWEPVLLRFLAIHEAAHASYDIDEIWAFEAVNHGDSSLINGGDRLGWMFDWQDNARDHLHFFLHYLPDSITTSMLPTHLPRLPDSVAHARKQYGFRDRTFVAIGHSLGGCTLTIAALECPMLFSSLVLVDPIIKQEVNGIEDFVSEVRRNASGAIQRRDGWSSRAEARAKFAATPFFASWDAAVRELYVQCALYDAPDGSVRLKMPGIQEALSFSEALASYETWDRLDQLDERVELRWVMPGKMTPPEMKIRERLVWRRPANSSNIIVPDAGHLISQERPGVLALDIHQLLERKYGSRGAKL